MTVAQPEVFELVTDQWRSLGLRPGVVLHLDRRPPRPGELVAARVNGYLTLGIWLVADDGACAIEQPRRIIRLTRPTQTRILGVLLR
jgi:hypothetical protein